MIVLSKCALSYVNITTILNYPSCFAVCEFPCILAKFKNVYLLEAPTARILTTGKSF